MWRMGLWFLIMSPHHIKCVCGGGVGGGTYCFWDGSRQRQRKTSCPLCNLNTLWNILMILGRNVDQGERTCCIKDWQLWLSYFWSYHTLFYLKKISCPLCNSNTFWNISMILGRNVEQDQRHVACNNDNSAFLTFGIISLSYIWQWSSIDIVSAL